MKGSQIRTVLPLITTLALLLLGCGIPEDEHAAITSRLTARIDSLESTIDELVNGPDRLIGEARVASEADDFNAVVASTSRLLDEHPGSSHVDEARELRASAQSEIERAEEERQAKEERRKAEEERRKRLGLRALSSSTRVEVGDTKLRFNSVRLRDRWTFDRYDSHWRYRDATRGRKYVVADVSITSSSNNPRLPGIFVYKSNDGGLQKLGDMDYEFYRWRDYGSYLGNYADYGNDFAHTETIRFVAGVSVSDELIAGSALFVLVGKSGCASRRSERFDNPPVEYSTLSCDAPSRLSIEQAERYQIASILNRGNL